mmetsp:Transcript_83077/g.144276  ORF Transcript_83077/g.144276 Transcript_83077/m.144276 type:complete len:604 (-) Transcript_83077:30-1841(-)
MSAEVEATDEVEKGEDEAGADPPELEETDKPPSHEPFAFRIFNIVSAQQSMNGLRHNDHLRYRQYCARRMRRLHNTLRFKNGRGRFKQAPFPADFTDMRFMEIPLVNAERAWSYGVQLKADNATQAEFNHRWRHHSIRRFAKAVKWATMLDSVAKRHADSRTQREAEAYLAFLAGTLFIEMENYSEALTKLTRCKKICEHLALALEQAEASNFKTKVAELAPMIRECRYKLGMGYGADDDEDEDATKSSSNAQTTDLSDFRFRGRGVSVPSDKIKEKLLKCLQLVSEIKVEDDEPQESGKVHEKYGEISTEFADVLKDIHSNMITADAEVEDQWRSIQAMTREFSLCMNVERNLLLLWKHLAKLPEVEDMASTEARKVRPDEGMRFCDLLKEDIRSLLELPDTTDEYSAVLSTYLTIVLNCRCFFLALCHSILGKTLESAALLDMLRNRIEDVDLSSALAEPLGRLHDIFKRVQQDMPSRVGKWRCRGLAALCTAEVAKAKVQKEEEPENADAKAGMKLEDLSEIACFPPRVRDVPCKPLLFDLAFPCIAEPDIEDLIPKSTGEGEQKRGLLGKVAGGVVGVAGGLGSRFGSLLGRGRDQQQK